MRIEISHMYKKISKNIVLNDINLILESGNIYGFVGKNGSGKTMLMRALCGLILPSQGVVKIDDKYLGKDISFPNSVGALIDSPGFISTYNGFKNLNFLAKIQNIIGDQEIKQVMEKVGLDPEDKRPYKKYSFGMRQRLGIAAAIMEKPNFLILDEPFNGLDEEILLIVKQIIKSYKSKERIIIISCHDSREINNICDKIIEIRRGTITNIKSGGDICEN